MSGGGQPASTTTKNTSTQNTPYAPAVPYLLQGLNDAARIYSQGPQQYTPWSQVAGFTPDQLAAQQGIMNYTRGAPTQQFIGNVQNSVANQMQGGTNYSQPLQGQAQSNLAGYLGNNNLQDNSGVLNQMAYGDQTNPYLDTAVQSSLQKLSNNFMANTLPSLRRAAIQQGTYGSSRNALAEGQAAGALDTAMQDAANTSYMTDYQQQETNRMNALGQLANQQNQQATGAQGLLGQSANTNLNNISQGFQNYGTALQMPLDMLGQIYNVGADQYAQNQAQLGDATNRWNFNQNAGWDQLQRFKALVDANSGLGQSTSSNSYSAQYAPPTSMVGNISSLLLQAAPAAMSAYGSMNANPATPAGTINPVSDNGVATGVKLQGLGPQGTGPTNIQPLG